MNEKQTESSLYRDALGPQADCPPAQELERLLSEALGAAPAAALAKHVESCGRCRTELHLLKQFQSGEVRAEETEAVRRVAERLRARSAEIFPKTAAPLVQDPWWKGLLRARWLSPAALAFAAVLTILAVGLQLRQGAPPVLRPISGGQEALRSGALAITAPIGDQQQVPAEIRWEAVPGAVKYEARLLEVDRTEMWKAETAGNSVALPPGAQARIVPAKTILCVVTAFDASGRKVAESEIVRFRLLQNVYSR